MIYYSFEWNLILIVKNLDGSRFKFQFENLKKKRKVKKRINSAGFEKLAGPNLLKNLIKTSSKKFPPKKLSNRLPNTSNLLKQSKFYIISHSRNSHPINSSKKKRPKKKSQKSVCHTSTLLHFSSKKFLHQKNFRQ